MYNPYGEVARPEGDGGANGGGRRAGAGEILYAGCRTDPEMGLHAVRFAFYHPTLGRWVVRDPAQEGQNLYENVKSNPANLIDPLGLMTLFDTPEKIRKHLNVEIRDPDDSRSEKTISTQSIRGTHTIRVGSRVLAGTAKNVQIDYHETVGIIGTEINGVGEGDQSRTVGVTAYFPPPWDKAEAEQKNNALYNKDDYQLKDTSRTGWHNLALIAELAAYAQKVKDGELSSATYAKTRWRGPDEGADVSLPGAPPVMGQEELRKMIRWMCECESKGVATPHPFTWDSGKVDGARWGGLDKMRFRLEILLECVNKKVQTKKLKMEYYD